MKIFQSFLISLIFLSYISISFSEPTDDLGILTPEELLAMPKVTDYLLSPDGKYLIYGVKIWYPSTGKYSTNLQYKNLETLETKNLTPVLEGQSDSSPQFSSAFSNCLFFQRSNKDVQSSIYYIQFPPEGKTEMRLTNYILPVNDFKIKAKSIIFSTDFYFECETMQCSKDLIDKESQQDYQVYTKLFMFHWDHWLVEGKGSHLFVQRIKLGDNNDIVLDGDAFDATKKMEIYTPPLFTDFSNYDISPNGEKIAFSAHIRNKDEAVKTGWETYFFDLKLMSNPYLITTHTEARTQNPVFSKDGTKIAYLAMTTPGLESEILHFEIYNILTGKTIVIPNEEELSITGFIWDTDSKIIFVANSYQENQLFVADIKDPYKPIVTKCQMKYTGMSYSLPYYAMKNKKVAVTKIVAYDSPERLLLIKGDTNEQIDIVNLNEEFIKTKFISEAHPFNFTGGYGETVYGFYYLPKDYSPDKTYPVAVLIHGGPEGSYTHAWGYSWNPQMYTGRGYAVIMINPHGSVGFGYKFQDDVRNHWGGAPFEDIILGVTHVLNKFPALDRTRMCAAGASYGGFMINWIEGHNDVNETLGRDWTFNCLANHDGIFSAISMYYATEEIWFPKEEFCDKNYGDCNPWESKEIRQWFEQYSPERYTNNWHTPMIIIHGGTDYRVPLTEGLSSFTTLQLRNIPSEFLFLHEENHWCLKPENQIKWYDRVYAFFDKYTNSGEYELSEEEKNFKMFNKRYKEYQF